MSIIVVGLVPFAVEAERCGSAAGRAADRPLQ